MFRKTTKNSRQTIRQLSGPENLEERRVMTTNYLLLDFSHDGQQGSLAQTYLTVKDAFGNTPSFFDTNWDGLVNMSDVTAAASQIANKLASIFVPFHNGNVQVRYGDVDRNTNLGSQWLNWGRQDSQAHVMVMYFGGTDGTRTGALGWAPVAQANRNVEGVGETLTTEIARYMLTSGRGNNSSQDFINRIAVVAAHEYGHMLGLQHTVNHQYDIMQPHSPMFNSNPANSQFAWEWVQNSDGNWQHPGYEVWKSFHYDTSEARSVVYYARPYGTDESLGLDSQHDHDHGSESNCQSMAVGAADLDAPPLSVEYAEEFAAMLQSLDHRAMNLTDVMPVTGLLPEASVPLWAGLQDHATISIWSEDNVLVMLLRTGETEARDAFFATDHDILDSAEPDGVHGEIVAELACSSSTTANNRPAAGIKLQSTQGEWTRSSGQLRAGLQSLASFRLNARV